MLRSQKLVEVLFWPFLTFFVDSRHFLVIFHPKTQIVGISEVCDPNGDRVSKSNKICHICNMRQKSVFVKYEKNGTLSIYNFNSLSFWFLIHGVFLMVWFSIFCSFLLIQIIQAVSLISKIMLS